MKVQVANVEKQFSGLKSRMRTFTDNIDAAQKHQTDNIAKLGKDNREIQSKLEQVVEKAGVGAE